MKGVLIGKAGKWIFQTTFGKKWTEEKVQRILRFLDSGTTILDLGCGSGNITRALREKGWNVTPADVADVSFHEDVRPVVYDGENLPFPDNHFHTALLLTVLHHTHNPETVLKEAVRVSSQVILIEDIYENIFQQYLTYFTDTIVNMGFSSMTYQNKNDKEWKALFAKSGLNLTAVSYKRVLLFFRQATYILMKA
ncbi:MAG: class I SAM-dependent methyltransferase [Bacteroidia bacterium]|nr:class I SAM-dependent methyltransferase [Bacteroidia bacterium]